MTTKHKLENVTVRLEAETREALEAMARAEDRPLSWLIRRALRAEAARCEAQTEHAV
jgi:predicted transcriptional regulator